MLPASPKTMTKVDEFRTVFESSLRDIHARTSDGDSTKRCLVLSGGVDTCAILEASSRLGIEFSGAFTVITGDESPDKGFAAAASKQHGLDHTIIRLAPEELVDTYLPTCVELLECYDGMTLRNSLVVAAAFKAASEKGFTEAVVAMVQTNCLVGTPLCGDGQMTLLNGKRSETACVVSGRLQQALWVRTMA
jgi:asparagine synthetase B (glutamine-hydrolysing)